MNTHRPMQHVRGHPDWLI